MRIDLFSVTGSPPGRLDWLEEELGSETKTKEDLEQVKAKAYAPEWDGEAIQTSLSLKAISDKNFFIKNNNFGGDPDNQMRNYYGEVIETNNHRMSDV
jgi:hypothetical protein